MFFEVYHSVTLSVSLNPISSLWVLLNTRITVGGATYPSGSHQVELVVLPPQEIIAGGAASMLLTGGQESSHYETWQKSVPSDSLDYLEIGTSSFDTVAGWVAELSAHHPSILTDVSGISIEPVASHLNSLPALPLALKVNAAVIGGGAPGIASIYHFVADKHLLSPAARDSSVEFLEMLQGCSCVHSVHPTLRKLGRHDSNFSLARVQKHWVRTVPISYVLRELVGGRDVGLVKLDVEGLDVQLTTDYLDYLEAKFSSRAASAHWPCVFAVEVHFMEPGLSAAASALVHRLSVVHGYSTFQDGINLVAVNCQCGSDRVSVLLLLLGGGGDVMEGLSEQRIRDTCRVA